LAESGGRDVRRHVGCFGPAVVRDVGWWRSDWRKMSTSWPVFAVKHVWVPVWIGAAVDIMSRRVSVWRTTEVRRTKSVRTWTRSVITLVCLWTTTRRRCYRTRM